MIAEWLEYAPGGEPGVHTVTGALKMLRGLYSPQLDNRRDLLALLPPSYGTADSRRYPVIYMHDGQNLFDEATSYAGEWQVDETMQTLAAEGIEAVVIGIPNMGVDRRHEYIPWRSKGESEGRGDAYLDFIVETVKPLVDASFRTLPGREYCMLAGSSLGGLISLYGFVRHPDVFGLVGAFSPAFGPARMGIFPVIDRFRYVPGRIYMDVGTEEAIGIEDDPLKQEAFSREYLRMVREVKYRLGNKGYRDGEELCYIEEEGARHHESAWARRLPGALRFLFGVQAARKE
jgi:predicted alpha/beta superfamily hydrolase